ncbi:FtsK/SpoIIIE domain-containing protein [Clostridium sp.]|uniref:FtsK/SpoIIIE domain-containing protein n=1 Tax=Clostridium sp. TaxID=1506 RepID=UPI00261B33FD|nr:FtsK/SpoIIIE domain-containing protein [Clostridium sp.]
MPIRDGIKIAKFEKKWISLMANLGLYNKLKQTYSLNKTKITSYGYKSLILIVDGLSLSKLETNKEYIQDSFGCMCVFNKAKRSNLINAEFIFNTPIKLKYLPIDKLKPWEIYLGNDYTGKPIIIDLIKYPHILITGGTRSGKSKMTDCILTNLITNCREKDLELYLCQVAKSDLILYEDAKQTRAFADTLDKTLTVLQHIEKKMNERNELIKPYRKKAKADNYMDYNKINPIDKLSTVYVVFDEMSSLFNEKGCTKEDKEIKRTIVAGVEKIAQYGASLGVFLICSLQRPTADNLSSFIKSQCTCRISFRQNNSKSSEVALDDPNLALGLEQIEFIYYTNKYSYGLVPLVDNKVVYSLIKEFLEDRHRDLFRDIALMKRGYKTKEKVKEVFPSHIYSKTTEDILKENIAQIEGYVPYCPSSNVIVIDKTNVPTITEKPKRGREKL